MKSSNFNSLHFMNLPLCLKVQCIYVLDTMSMNFICNLQLYLRDEFFPHGMDGNGILMMTVMKIYSEFLKILCDCP